MRTNSLNLAPKSVKRIERTEADIEREIAEAEAGHTRAKRDFAKATRALTKTGVGVMKTVTDSQGKSFKALRVSPNVRILEASQKCMKVFAKRIESLKSELALLRAPKVMRDSTDEFFEDEQ